VVKSCASTTVGLFGRVAFYFVVFKVFFAGLLCQLVRTHFPASSLFFALECCSGIDFKIRTIDLDGKKVKLQIWFACYNLL